MVVFINQTGTLGVILSGLTSNITGNLFLSLLFVLLLVLMLAVAFRIPIEFIMILCLPFMLILLAFAGDFMPVAGIILLFLAIILGKNFFFGR
jgi:hypothetical protein